MNCLETSIIIQKELDKCNEKMKNYEIKYNTEKKESLKILYDYLNKQILNCDDSEKKIIMDDIYTLSKYLDIELENDINLQLQSDSEYESE
jgi:hypothetical protein